MRIKSDGVEEKDWSKAEKALDGIGIKIRNLETGEMRNFMDILRDIAKEWEHMDDASRMALGEAMGNKFCSFKTPLKTVKAKCRIHMLIPCRRIAEM